LENWEVGASNVLVPKFVPNCNIHLVNDIHSDKLDKMEIKKEEKNLQVSQFAHLQRRLSNPKYHLEKRKNT
jgi:hypothetical protein